MIDSIMFVFSYITEKLISPTVVFALLFFGVYVGIRLRFFNIMHPKMIIKVLNGKNAASSIRTLTLALAGTLGVGNIVGVASAIVSGGAGAIFWMWVSAFLSMLIKYCEVFLAVRHREKSGKDNIGGAMFYMKKHIALPFSILCICAAFAIGNFLQVNAIVESADLIGDIPRPIIGLLLCVIVWLATGQGLRGISSVTLFLVPLMSLVYTMLSLIVIINNITLVPSVFARICRSAFGSSAILGGIGGHGIANAMKYGINRGIISNEAGCGTAPMAYASGEEKSPVKQGFWGIFEVFADTIIMCTLTAFVILLNFDDRDTLTGMELVISSFGTVIGNAATPLISLCVLLFGVATMIGWSYYGITAVTYLTDEKKRKKYVKLYLFLYSISSIIAAVTPASVMWLFSDFCIGSMTLLNIYSIYPKISDIAKETRKYIRSNNAEQRYNR